MGIQETKMLWRLNISDIIIIAVFGALSRIVTRIGLILPLPPPIGDFYFAIQLAFFVCLCATIVRKPGTVILFTFIQMIINVLFFGGSPLWAMENLIFGIVTEAVVVLVYLKSKQYASNFASILLLGTVIAFMDFVATYFVVFPFFYDLTYDVVFYLATGIPYTLAGTIMGIIGWRVGVIIKPLIGK